jgi:hypothetical protein
MKDSNYWIEKLGMIPHPEGGYYHSSYKSSQTMFRHDIAGVSSSERNLWSSIYLLLTEEDFTSFHRVRSEEVWYYHHGSSVKIYMISPEGDLTTAKLGLDLDQNEKMQVLIPKNYIIAAERIEDTHAMIGIMVSPGFDFDDIKIYDKDELTNLFPMHEEIISRLCMESFY